MTHSFGHLFSFPETTTKFGFLSPLFGLCDIMLDGSTSFERLKFSPNVSHLLKGFGDRLVNEMRKITPKELKIRISAPQERLYSTWIGGSILASLDTFKRMWVSRREYDHEGHRVIHRKTF